MLLNSPFSKSLKRLTILAVTVSAISFGTFTNSALAAARSTLVHFHNLTESSLTLVDENLSHGVWTRDSLPPDSISAQSQNASWQSESDGFMTGTEGHVNYHMDAGDVYMHWDNPFAGDNSYADNAPAGYSISHTEGSGDNAEVTFNLTKDS